MPAGRPSKPVEQKKLLGNPGRRPLPKAELDVLTSGYIEPIRPLDWSGKQLWDSVFKHGELWVSSRTDVHVLQMTCEQLDRRDSLLALVPDNPNDRTLNMNLNELEKAIAANLGRLGFTPADRSRLGFTIAKTESKLEQLRRMSNGD
jgi:hypothetical protein